MKALYKGITMEGTPKEIFDLKTMMDNAEMNEQKKWKPYTWPSTYPGTWYGYSNIGGSIITTTKTTGNSLGNLTTTNGV